MMLKDFQIKSVKPLVGLQALFFSMAIGNNFYKTSSSRGKGFNPIVPTADKTFLYQ